MITKAIFYFGNSKPRKRYREGDRRTVKGRVYVKVPVMAHEPNGRVAGYSCRNGRQIYEWIREDSGDLRITPLRAP